MAKILHGLRALVTGGATGIGAACARVLASQGARVTIADINELSAAKIAHEIDGEVWQVDLAETATLETLQLDADILVNNAGAQQNNAIPDVRPEDWRYLHRLMVEAPFLLIRSVLPGMYDRGFGRVINISSILGLRGAGYQSAYVSAKHGLEGLSKATAAEGGPHGVTSNCINPAYVRTPLVEKQLTDQAEKYGISQENALSETMMTNSMINSWVEPEEIASLAAWLASPQADMVTGASYAMDGGWLSQ